MNDEAKLWQDLRNVMTARWDAQRHEDKYSTGIPDVSYGIAKRADGWIELKNLPALPAGMDRRGWDFRYDHFTADQRNWAEMRTRHGRGRVYLMVRFGDEVTAIWNWSRIRCLLGTSSLNEILNEANAVWWRTPIDGDELFRVLADNRVIPLRFRL